MDVVCRASEPRWYVVSGSDSSFQVDWLRALLSEHSGERNHIIHRGVNGLRTSCLDRNPFEKLSFEISAAGLGGVVMLVPK